MKQKFIILALIFAGFSLNLNAQIDVTVNPIPLLWGAVDAGVDIGFRNDLSVEPRIGLDFGNITISSIEYKAAAFEFSAIGKYYFNPDDGCDKWHVGPYFEYLTGKYTAAGESDVQRTKFGLGLYFGYKIVSTKKIVFDIGLGGGRNFTHEFESDNGDELDLANFPFFNISLIGKLAVGYRFGGGK